VPPVRGIFGVQGMVSVESSITTRTEEGGLLMVLGSRCCVPYPVLIWTKIGLTGLLETLVYPQACHSSSNSILLVCTEITTLLQLKHPFVECASVLITLPSVGVEIRIAVERFGCFEGWLILIGISIGQYAHSF